MGGVTGLRIMDVEEGSKWMCEQISSAKAGWAAGKLGTSEFNALMWYIKRSLNGPTPYPDQFKRDMFVNAGLWIPDGKTAEQVLDDWGKDAIAAIKALDGVAVWNPMYNHHEENLVRDLNPRIKAFKLRVLEPYYTPNDQYTLNMTGGPIAIVTPFTSSIADQTKQLTAVFPPYSPTGPMWPSNATFHCIQAMYTPNLSSNPAQTWSDTILKAGYKAAIKSLADQVEASKARYAFVGIGAMSLPLVAELKQRGIIAIHTGGATQIMFGVKGRRWDGHNIISTFYNDSWIRPYLSEVPNNASKVEGGCYW